MFSNYFYKTLIRGMLQLTLQSYDSQAKFSLPSAPRFLSRALLPLRSLCKHGFKATAFKTLEFTGVYLKFYNRFWALDT